MSGLALIQTLKQGAEQLFSTQQEQLRSLKAIKDPEIQELIQRVETAMKSTQMQLELLRNYGQPDADKIKSIQKLKKEIAALRAEKSGMDERVQKLAEEITALGTEKIRLEAAVKAKEDEWGQLYCQYLRGIGLPTPWPLPAGFPWPPGQQPLAPLVVPPPMMPVMMPPPMMFPPFPPPSSGFF